MAIRSDASGRSGPKPSWIARTSDELRRAFTEFLTIPTLIIAAFLGFSALMFRLDHLRMDRNWPDLFPGTHDSIRALLETIAASIITVTSITFSLLLIAVQQGASTLTAQVYDQFLRRRANQAYFGYFTGLALYCLIILAATHPEFTPLYSAIAALLMTVIALYLLILLLYSTIDQMRPVVIVENIRDHTLRARAAQLPLLAASERTAETAPGTGLPVVAADSGYLTLFDPQALVHAARDCTGATHVVLLRSVGDYVSIGERLAEVYVAGGSSPDVEPIRRVLPLRKQRDLDCDAAFGIEQLTTIGWTSASTSKSNPHPGRLACWNLRDLVASWCETEQFVVPGDGPPAELKIIYPDNVPTTLLRAFESLAVVASESMQHQTLAAVYRALALAVGCVPKPLKDEVLGIVGRSLAALGDHVLTADLDEAIGELERALAANGLDPTRLTSARTELANSNGRLNSRATRVTR